MQRDKNYNSLEMLNERRQKAREVIEWKPEGQTTIDGWHTYEVRRYKLKKE